MIVSMVVGARISSRISNSHVFITIQIGLKTILYPNAVSLTQFDIRHNILSKYLTVYNSTQN